MATPSASLPHRISVAALALGLGACSGIDSGIAYPSDLPSDLGPMLLTPENEADPSIGFNAIKFSPELCKGIDTHPVTAPLNQEDFSRFLDAQGVKIEAKKARGNLYWYDFPNGEAPPEDHVRLRLAILADANEAAKDLHHSILEHGPGWWGLRRGNLAILAPKARFREALGFAIKHKLPCWGVFTWAGNDDAFVVPGPYAEL